MSHWTSCMVRSYTSSLQPVRNDGAMWPQHWALWQCISVAVSCRSSPRNASLVPNCPMDEWTDRAWGLQKLQTTAAACKILSKHPQSALLSTYLSAAVDLFSQGLLTYYWKNCDLQLHALPALAVFVRDPAHPRVVMDDTAMTVAVVSIRLAG